MDFQYVSGVGELKPVLKKKKNHMRSYPEAEWNNMIWTYKTIENLGGLSWTYRFIFLNFYTSYFFFQQRNEFVLSVDKMFF